MQEMQKNLKTYVDQNVSKSSYKQTFVCNGCGERHTRKTFPLSRDKKETNQPLGVFLTIDRRQRTNLGKREQTLHLQKEIKHL